MTVESATYVNQLDITLPSNTDFLHEGDNHVTLIKKALKNTFKTSNKQYDMDTIAGGIVPIGAVMLWSLTGAAVPAGWAICDGRTVARTDGLGNITTPDMRGLFPLGGDQNTGLNDTGGAWEKTANTATNGAHTHTNPWTSSNGGHDHGGGGTGWHALTLAQIPVHNHGGGAHTHTENQSAIEFRNTSPVSNPYFTTATSGQTVVNQTVNSGGSGTIIANNGSGQSHNHSIPWQGTHNHSIGNTGSAGGHVHSVTVNVTPPYKRFIYIMKH
jgi:microcystin-dependent protein